MAFFILLLLLIIFTTTTTTMASNTTTTYIVFMNPSSHNPTLHPTPSHWYSSHLLSLSIPPSLHLLYSYSLSLSAFSASLLPHHLPLLRSSPAVLLLLPDPLLPLHTTRSPHFLHLPPPPLPPPTSDVIIGILDTGIWPELPSFSSSLATANLSPVPARWKGECEAGVDFSPALCNRKLIGARSFSRGFRASRVQRQETVFASARNKETEFASARDRDGHGTHTASTAAGLPVANASLLGYARGTARGMAPAARIAAYKVGLLEILM